MAAPARRLLVIDASSLINLEASQVFTSIVDDCGYLLGVVDPQVWREALHVLRPDPSGAIRETIALDVHERDDRVVRLVLDPIEFGSFVRFASRIDDGEAAALAVALARGLPLLVDDLAVRRLIAADGLGLPLLTTAGLLREWSGGRAADAIAEALLNVETFGRFVPPASDPDYGWWIVARSG